MRTTVVSAVLVSAAFSLTACATQETFRALETPKTASAQQPYHGARVAVSIGKFDNRSSYMRGIFSDGVDRLGGQGLDLVQDVAQGAVLAVLGLFGSDGAEVRGQVGDQVAGAGRDWGEGLDTALRTHIHLGVLVDEVDQAGVEVAEGDVLSVGLT